MMHFFQVYKCTFFKKIKTFINKFLYELILYKKRFEQQFLLYQTYAFNMVDLTGIEPVSKDGPTITSTA